jgi:PAS domain S-box-containing protein
MMIYLPDGRPLLINDAAAELWGHSSKDLEYLFYNYNIFKDESLKAKGIMPYIKRAFAGEFIEIPPVKYEPRKAKISTESGRSALWISSYLYPVKDAGGSVSLVVTMHEDITERKRIEDFTRQQLDLGQALNTTADIHEALSLCLQAAIEVSGMDSGGIYLVDRSTGALELVCHQGLSAEFIKTASHFKAGSPNTLLIMKGKPVYREYTQFLPGEKDPVREQEELRFIGIVPVLYEGSVIACMNIASHIIDKIPVTGRNALETLALQIGGIIARLQAEDARRESEERYRTLQTNIPVGIFRTSPDGQIISANPAMVRMFGYESEEEFLALSASGYYLFTWDRKKLLNGLKDKSIVTDFEVQLKRKDGSSFWGSFNVKGVADKQGNILSHDGILEDISERKKWAEAIVQAREEWERTFDSVPELITILDKEFTIIRANKAAADKLGIPKAKLVGLPCFKAFHNKAEPPHSCPHYLMLKEGKEHTVEIHEESLNSDFLVTVSPLYNGKGKLIGAVHTARDITESKKLDEELQKAEKLESLGLLAGGIAHDFNNILTSILLSISLTKTYVKHEEKAVIRLSEAEKAVTRAKDLTQQLLTFSRGGAPIRSQSSIEGLLRDTAEFALSGSNVKSEFEINSDLREVEIDEGQISQVIQNLVMNSVQAMPEGGRIRITAKNYTVEDDSLLHLSAGEYIKITVKDRGVGIAKEFLNKIFDPFFSTKQKGSGLGLSTAYSIIKNHNGLLKVESEFGKGTAFFLYLPASKKIAKKKELEKQLPAAGKGKVLLMDDEEIILDSTSDILTEIGYTVGVAQDGSEAIKLYKEAVQSGEPFDVVIMDLVVPGGMGGVETLQELLKIDPGVKAIVSSGYSTDPVIANFEEYGFAGAVSKPYKIEDMYRLIRQAIAEKKESGD